MKIKDNKLNACAQQAVWRKRGRGSPESLCGFGSFEPVRAVVNPPPAPSRQNVVRNRRQRSGQ
jgi:hypothetical protein